VQATEDTVVEFQGWIWSEAVEIVLGMVRGRGRVRRLGYAAQRFEDRKGNGTGTLKDRGRGRSGNEL
jgi:hypothetical protein